MGQVLAHVGAFLATIAPIFATESPTYPEWVGGIGLLRDGLNAGLIGALIWGVQKIMPHLRDFIINHNTLITTLNATHQKIVVDIGETRADVKELRKACPAAKLIPGESLHA